MNRGEFDLVMGIHQRMIQIVVKLKNEYQPEKYSEGIQKQLEVRFRLIDEAAREFWAIKAKSEKRRGFLKTLFSFNAHSQSLNRRLLQNVSTVKDLMADVCVILDVT